MQSFKLVERGMRSVETKATIVVPDGDSDGFVTDFDHIGSEHFLASQLEIILSIYSFDRLCQLIGRDDAQAAVHSKLFWRALTVRLTRAGRRRKVYSEQGLFGRFA